MLGIKSFEVFLRSGIIPQIFNKLAASLVSLGVSTRSYPDIRKIEYLLIFELSSLC